MREVRCKDIKELVEAIIKTAHSPVKFCCVHCDFPYWKGQVGETTLIYEKDDLDLVMSNFVGTKKKGKVLEVNYNITGGIVSLNPHETWIQ